MWREDGAWIEAVTQKEIYDCLDQAKEHADKILPLLKAKANHPLTDNVHTLTLEPEDHIAENRLDRRKL